MESNKVTYLDKNLSRINKALLNSIPEKNYSEITKAIHYSVMNGGKRMRPQLMLLMAEALKVDVDKKRMILMVRAGEVLIWYD